MSEEGKFYINTKRDIVPIEKEFIPVTGLKPIESEQLIYSRVPDDDRVCTDLKLCDYDWAQYSLSTRFHTEENGLIRVQWDYMLAGFSKMFVTQIKDNTITYYDIQCNADLFGSFLIRFLNEHMKQWEPNTYAFNGEEIVIDFFNEALDKGNLCGKVSTSKDVPNYLSWQVNENECFDIIKRIKDLSDLE